MSGHPEELLSAYVDGELDAERLREVEEHLASCTACREIVESIRIVARNTISKPLDEVTARRFLQESRSRRNATTSADGHVPAPTNGRVLKLTRPSHFRLKKPLLVAASAAAIIVLATIIGSFDNSLRDTFADPAGSQTMGQNQAALSAGIYN